MSSIISEAWEYVFGEKPFPLCWRMRVFLPDFGGLWFGILDVTDRYGLNRELDPLYDWFEHESRRRNAHGDEYGEATFYTYDGVRYIRAHYFTALDQHGTLYEYWITEVIQPVNSELTGILRAPDQAHIMDSKTTKHFSNGNMMYILRIDSNSENHWLDDFYARADAIAEARREEALGAEVVLQAEQLFQRKTCKG